MNDFTVIPIGKRESIMFMGIEFAFAPLLPPGVIVTTTREAITVHMPNGTSTRYLPHEFEARLMSPPETKNQD